MGSALEEAAAAFERHVELDESVLATSAPMDLSQLDVVMLQVGRHCVVVEDEDREIGSQCADAGERGVGGVSQAQAADERPAREADGGEVRLMWRPSEERVDDGGGAHTRVVHRSIGSADAVSRLLALLEGNAKAMQYFKATIVSGTSAFMAAVGGLAAV